MVCILCTLLHYLALYWSFLVHLAPSCTIFHYLALSCTIWPLSTLSPAPSHSWNNWIGGGNIQILSYFTLQLISTKQWANCISKAKQHKIEPWHHCLGLMPTANKKSWNTQTLWVACKARWMCSYQDVQLEESLKVANAWVELSHQWWPP